MEPPIAPIWEPILRERGCEIIEDDGKQILRDIFEYYFWRVKKLRGVRAGARGIFLVKQLNQSVPHNCKKRILRSAGKTAALRNSPAAGGVRACGGAMPPCPPQPARHMRKNSPLKKFFRAKNPEQNPAARVLLGNLAGAPQTPQNNAPSAPRAKPPEPDQSEMLFEIWLREVPAAEYDAFMSPATCESSGMRVSAESANFPPAGGRPPFHAASPARRKKEA